MACRAAAGAGAPGHWPTRLAEGYTALIPKEGPPGLLVTQPLTVLSMVSCLWAGVHLVDAICWQGAWAHPSAFNFRWAHSALDGAVVTQVLRELCCLQHWSVAGMSIGYVKCFNLTPQAVVLALALELGMDPGACRALGRKQVTKRSTHARPGMHMQQCSAVPEMLTKCTDPVDLSAF